MGNPFMLVNPSALREKDIHAQDSSESAPITPPTNPVLLTPHTKLWQSARNADYAVDITVRSCTSGCLKSRRFCKGKPATLLILDTRLVCQSGKGSFNQFKLALDFRSRSGTRTEKTGGPTIIGQAPFATQECFNLVQNTVERKKGHEVSINANADVKTVGKVGAEVKKIDEEKITSRHQYFATGNSNNRVDHENGSSSVWWNVCSSSDPDAKDDKGIPANYRFAVLVAPENGTQFEVCARVEFEAGWRQKRERGWELCKAVCKGQPIKGPVCTLVEMARNIEAAKVGPFIPPLSSKYRGAQPLEKWVDVKTMSELTDLSCP